MDLGLLFPFLVIFHLVPLLSAQECNYSSVTCPRCFRCQNNRLSFPFTDISQPDCGLWMVDCNSQPYPKIKLAQASERWFDAEDMSQEDWFKLKDPKLSDLLNNQSCDTFFHDIPLPRSSPVSFRILSNITLFLCRKVPQLSQAVIDHFHEYKTYDSCKEFNIYYRNPKFHSSECRIPPHCSIVNLPCRHWDLAAENGQLFQFLTPEFDLQWNVSDECLDDCHLKGGPCQTDEMSNFDCPNDARVDGNKKGVILGTAIAGSVFLSIIVLASFLIWRHKKVTKNASCFFSRNASSTKPDLEGGSIYFRVPIFSYTELEEVTNNFDASKELGDGGFGTVYYGKLRDGREVAVKRLYEHNFKRMEQFINEIEILTRLRHSNLVSLYGCTSRHSRELLLVYEYIPNGTVADHLHGERAKDRSLKWPIRMNIAIETAGALAYLHASDIIHRDVKTNNILLDHNFCVKVADFGLSRLFPSDVSHISTAPQGTPGYVDPEYHQCYQLTDKSDVYSFGVVLIELISSMPAVDIRRHHHEINLANLAINRVQRCALRELIDPSLGFESDPGVMRMTTSVAELAFRCLQLEKEMRPTMDEVLETLKQIQNYKDNSVENENATEFESRTAKVPPSPEFENTGLLRNKIEVPPSPNAVTDAWASSSSANSTSR